MGELPTHVHVGHFQGPWFLDLLSVERSVSCSVMYDSLRPHGLYSPPGSSVHGILQARRREWVAISSSREGSSRPQRLYPGLLHCRQILYRLSLQGCPGSPWLHRHQASCHTSLRGLGDCGEGRPGPVVQLGHWSRPGCPGGRRGRGSGGEGASPGAAPGGGADACGCLPGPLH